MVCRCKLFSHFIPIASDCSEKSATYSGLFPGLNGPPGPECNCIKDFILLEKDISPSSLKLVKLTFLKEGPL